MKKIMIALLSTAMFLLVCTPGVFAADNSAWLISESEVVICPAELTKGYSEGNSTLFDTDLSGYNFLHFKMKFAEKTEINYDKGVWGYLILTDNIDAIGQYEASQNVVASNIAATKEYEADTWYDVVIPFSGFSAYGVESKPIAEWTAGAKLFRFVLVAADNSELQFKDIYVSVNENDVLPSDASDAPETVAEAAPETAPEAIPEAIPEIVPEAAAETTPAAPQTFDIFTPAAALIVAAALYMANVKKRQRN